MLNHEVFAFLAGSGGLEEVVQAGELAYLGNWRGVFERTLDLRQVFRRGHLKIFLAKTLALLWETASKSINRKPALGIFGDQL